ncbi:MAG TPA: hypothetical protein VJJ76_00025 [archaeon]|nr:hypothetical protein [archaeon]
MKFALKRAKKFGWQGLKGWAYSSKKDFKRASAAYFEINGSHGKIKTIRSDRIYFVIQGKGKFIIKNKIFSVKSKDVIIVPKNVPYDYSGKMKLFLVHTPSFDAAFERQLKK